VSYGNNGWTCMKIQFSSLLLDIPVFWWANHRTKCAMVLPGCRWRAMINVAKKTNVAVFGVSQETYPPIKCVWSDHVWMCLPPFQIEIPQCLYLFTSLFFLMLFGNPQIDLVVKCYLLLSCFQGGDCFWDVFRIKLQCWSILTKEKPIHITLHLQNVDYT
jgi:hypothetical protein